MESPPEDIIGALPYYAQEWLLKSDHVEVPMPEMLCKYMPITIETAGTGRFSMLPHFQRDNMWFASTLPETPNTAAIKKVFQLSNYVPPKVRHCRTILDLRNSKTRMIEVVQYEDGSYLYSKTVRFPSGEIRTVSDFIPCDECELSTVLRLRRDTHFHCKLCGQYTPDCQCSLVEKMTNLSGGLTTLNGNNTKQLFWARLRTFICDVFNHNDAIASIKLFYRAPNSEWAPKFQKLLPITYYSYRDGTNQLSEERDKYIMEFVYSIGPRAPLTFSMDTRGEIGISGTNMHPKLDYQVGRDSNIPGEELDILSMISDPVSSSERVPYSLALHSSESQADASGASGDWSAEQIAIKANCLLEGAQQERSLPNDLSLKEDPHVDVLCDPKVLAAGPDRIQQLPSSMEDRMVEDDIPSQSTRKRGREDENDKKSDSKSLICSTCSKAFNRKYDLSRHVTTVHEKKRRFFCEICDLGFLQRAHLNEHVSSVHERKRSSFCEKCNLTFSSRSRLTRHDRAVHQRLRPWACDKCDCRYFQRTDLKKHQNLKHREAAEENIKN